MAESYDTRHFEVVGPSAAPDTRAKYGKRLTELQKYNLLAMVAEGKLTNAELSKRFGVAKRTIERYRVQYRTHGRFLIRGVDYRLTGALKLFPWALDVCKSTVLDLRP